MKFSRRLLAIPMVIFVLALIVQAPAGLLDPLVRKMTAGRLQLAEARGSAWGGAARLVCRLADSHIACGQLQWQLDGRSLWRGQLVLRMTTGIPGEGAVVSLSPSGWKADTVLLTLPASLIGSFDQKLAALGLGGMLRFEGSSVSAREGAFSVLWNLASTQLAPGSLLGEYRFDVMNTPAGQNMTVTTQKGPVAFSGSGQFASDGRLQIDMTATVPPGDGQFAPLLNMIGKSSGDNAYRLQLPVQ